MTDKALLLDLGWRAWERKDGKTGRAKTVATPALALTAAALRAKAAQS